jgi:hypothetical protein
LTRTDVSRKASAMITSKTRRDDEVQAEDQVDDGGSSFIAVLIVFLILGSKEIPELARSLGLAKQWFEDVKKETAEA